MKLKKGDQVVITIGKDRGKRGNIERVYTNDSMVLIPGLNMYKKHLKKKDDKKQGGIVEFSKPVPVANVQIICPKCSKPTRIGYLVKKENKLRICRKCGSVL